MAEDERMAFLLSELFANDLSLAPLSFSLFSFSFSVSFGYMACLESGNLGASSGDVHSGWASTETPFNSTAIRLWMLSLGLPVCDVLCPDGTTQIRRIAPFLPLKLLP